MKTLDLDEQVSELTTPSFIWTTKEDAIVPCENSLSFAMQLAKRKIPFELHVYPNGGHGKSTGTFEINAQVTPAEARISQWIENCTAFFRSFCVEKF